MSIEKLVPFAVGVVFYMASGSGSLIHVISFIRRAEVQLIQDTKASKWPKAPMLAPFKRPF